MCNGAAFFRGFTWGSFAQLARADFKPDVPSNPGVYCLWVKKAATTDPSRIIARYESTELMKSLRVLAEPSRGMFKELSLASDGYGWQRFNSLIGCDTARNRIDRIQSIATAGGRLTCPILYFGGSSKLQQRLDELAFGGHTANHAVWALLISGWILDIGWAETSVPWRHQESAIKDRYRRLHGGTLPALMDR